jgi:dienelactone hydrolase
MTRDVVIDTDDARLAATLAIPSGAAGVVIFAHGSGSSRHSPRNRAVAARLNAAGFATLLLDLLTPEEDMRDQLTAELRFDIALLTRRLTGAVYWAAEHQETARLPVGLFGASTGGAAALATAAQLHGPQQFRSAPNTAGAEGPPEVRAIVVRGGRPDLAGRALTEVRAATLLIVGGNDRVVLEINRRACALMRTECALAVIPGATHLFEEPGALEQVSQLAVEWFTRHLFSHRGGET